MTRQELKTRNNPYPYLDPPRKYSWWNLLGGVIMLLGVGACFWIILYIF